MKYDELLGRLGGFGRYQRFQFAMVWFASYSSYWTVYSAVFLAPDQDHHCTLPGTPPPSWVNLTDQQILHLNIPLEETLEAQPTRSRCRMYNISDVDWTQGDYLDWVDHNRTVHGCMNGWTYSNTYYESTVVSQWDLVCARAYQRQLAASLYFAGRVVSGLLSGSAADKWGRRPVFFISAVGQVVTGVLAAFSPWFWLFLASYFLHGAFQVVIIITTVVVGVETVSPKHRKVVGTLLVLGYSFANLTLVGTAYGLRQWRYVMLFASLPPALYLTYWWSFPESIRYLQIRGRKEEAKRIIKRCAKMNKVVVPDDVIDQLDMDNKSHSLLETFRNRNFVRLALTTCAIWFAIYTIYVGLGFSTGFLQGDPYLNFAINACVEIPGYLLGLVLLDRVSRRRLSFCFLVLAGVACITAAFVSPVWAVTLTFLLSKLFTMAALGIMNLTTAELLPTVVRNAGVGIASTCGRMGGLVAPQILLLRDYGPYVPWLIFGILPIIGALLFLTLPETTGKPLPQTVKDAEMDGIYTVDAATPRASSRSFQGFKSRSVHPSRDIEDAAVIVQRDKLTEKVETPVDINGMGMNSSLDTRL